MEFKKKAVCFLLGTLGIISATFSICHPLFLSAQDQIASLATVQVQQPLIPIDPLDATDSDAACHIRCHSITSIDSRSNRRSQELKDATAVKVTLFTEISIQQELIADFFPPRLTFDSATIQERLALLGVILS